MAKWEFDVPFAPGQLPSRTKRYTRYTKGYAGNEIGFADLSTFGGGFPPETIAVEFTGRTITGTMGGPLQCVITRTDIVFADNRIWRLGPLPNTRLGANLLSLGIVATHEIGHALTLAHSNGFLARMNASYPNSGPIGNNSTDGPLVDEIRAMRVLYQGTDSTTRDLVASRYKNNNAEIADLNQVKRASDNARVNTLNRGTAYYLDYSIENHGNTGENSVSLGFYFSTDRTITSSDFLLGNLIVNMGYGATQSSTVWLQLPNNTPTGLGYLGYVIDDASTVNEVDEVNNGVNLLSTVRDGSFRIN